MANTFDPSGANNMAAIKDRITKTLSDATRDMTPLETLGNIGRAAAQAATGHTTFGDVMNAQNAQRLKAAEQMMGVLQQERQLELQEQAGARAESQLGLQKEQFGLQEKQFDLQSDKFEQQTDMEKKRFGLEEDTLNLRREELTHKKLQDKAAQGDADAKAVVDALQSLVPEDQRAIYAAALADLPYAVDKTNVVKAVGRIRRDLEEKGGIPGDMADYDDEAGLRKEFEGQSKTFVDVRDSYNRVVTSAANPSPAGDMAMIFNFMKMLDPGSAVREQEFSNAANAAPALERAGISFEKISALWEGKMLTDRQRQDFVTQAKGLFKSALGFQDRLAEGWEGIAKRRGFDERNVVLDYAGPLRFQVMSDEELAAAAESASSPAAAKAIEEEFNRRRAGEQ